MTMNSSPNSALEAIQRDLLAGDVPVTRTLQKVILLGGQIGSTELRTWARRELDGYGPDDDLPGHRIVNAQIYMDYANGNAWVKGTSLGADQLPDFVREKGIGNDLPVRQGLAEGTRSTATAARHWLAAPGWRRSPSLGYPLNGRSRRFGHQHLWGAAGAGHSWAISSGQLRSTADLPDGVSAQVRPGTAGRPPTSQADHVAGANPERTKHERPAHASMKRHERAGQRTRDGIPRGTVLNRYGMIARCTSRHADRSSGFNSR